MTADPSLSRYTHSANRAASVVISAYSTSFGAATRMLGVRHRQHVRNIYALVRVADELVDGVAQSAGLPAAAQHEALQHFEEETYRAIHRGYSSDLIIHAFAQTARVAGIDEDLTRPFFKSMRADLPGLDSTDPAGLAGSTDSSDPDSSDPYSTNSTESIVQHFDETQHGEYVYGSAQVVGLMCLRVFLREERLSPEDLARLEHGARQLGSAFQNVNFLRDLADDTERLGRSYLSADGRLTDEDRDRWVGTIETELVDARETLFLLPKDARGAVRCALNLFAALVGQLARTPMEELYRKRVRVSNWRKTAIVVKSLIQTRAERR